MRLRAVIFDVYGTLLHRGPPPNDAAARWRWLWENSFGVAPRIDPDRFLAACDAIVRREHAAARFRGIAQPEIYWPEVIAEVVPEISAVSRRVRDAFEVGLARLQHTTGLLPGAVPVLRLLLASGVTIGIASNAQPYTLRELDDALTAVGLGTDIFKPELTFWSFQHGFAKPDPHVFQLLTARLRAFGIAVQDTLMVGDCSRNDIIPAQVCGWKTFQLAPTGAPEHLPGGDWHALTRWLDGRLLS